MANNFYVYLHRKKTDGTVFYIGKGTGKRAYIKFGRSTHWKNIVAKHGIKVDFAITGVQEWYALELECLLISYFGRENLCNQTDGGDGMWNPPEEFRQKMSKRFKGVNQPWNSGERNPSKRPEVKAKISESKKGSTTCVLNLRKLNKTSKGVARPWMSKGKNANAKQVKCLETNKTFDSYASAVQWLKSIGFKKASHGLIGQAVNGKRQSAYGFTWTSNLS